MARAKKTAKRPARSKKAAKKAAKKATKRAPSKKGGRPTALTEATHAELVRMLRAGAYLSHAAAQIGVDRRTVGGWIKRGRDDIDAGKLETRHAKLAAACEQARGQAAASMVQIITDAASRDWKAAAWYLERVHPREFGPTKEVVQRHTLDLDDDDDDLDLSELSDGELELLERSLVKAEQVVEGSRRRRRSG